MPSRQRRGGLPAHGTRRSNDVGFLRIRHPHVDRDVLVGFIPPWESASRPNHGVTGEGVDEDGNVFVAEGPASLSDAGSAFTKYVVAGM